MSAMLAQHSVTQDLPGSGLGAPLPATMSDKLHYIGDLTQELFALSGEFPTLAAFLRASHQEALRLREDLGQE